MLALLGFGVAASGCTTKEMYGPPPPYNGRLMYGILQVPFEVKGAVTDTDGRPIKDIRVVLKLRDDETDENLTFAKALRDTVYTDARGEFRTAQRDRYGTRPWTVIAEDVDGAKNGGEFETAQKVFHLNGGEPYDREQGADIETVDFTLTPKAKADEEGEE